ncbi:MAG: glycosyltransferase family 2 protein [Ardenticatenaceae bacterium]
MKDLFRLDYPSQPFHDTYQIGLLMTTYNRPDYLERCLASLAQSTLSQTLLLLVDDASDDERTLEMIRAFNPPNIPVLKAFREQKEGCAMYENLRYGWEWLREQYNCTYLSNLDPDTIVRKEWLVKIHALYERQRANGPLIVTGFNAHQHPILATTRQYYHKKSLGGLNLFFDVSLYEQIVRPSLVGIDWDWRVVAAMDKEKYRILCTRPSVIQHIGREGFWSGKHGVYDFAIDYWGSSRVMTMPIELYFRGRRRLGSWKARLEERFQ